MLGDGVLRGACPLGAAFSSCRSAEVSRWQGPRQAGGGASFPAEGRTRQRRQDRNGWQVLADGGREPAPGEDRGWDRPRGWAAARRPGPGNEIGPSRQGQRSGARTWKQLRESGGRGDRRLQPRPDGRPPGTRGGDGLGVCRTGGPEAPGDPFLNRLVAARAGRWGISRLPAQTFSSDPRTAVPGDHGCVAVADVKEQWAPGPCSEPLLSPPTR